MEFHFFTGRTYPKPPKEQVYGTSHILITNNQITCCWVGTGPKWHSRRWIGTLGVDVTLVRGQIWEFFTGTVPLIVLINSNFRRLIICRTNSRLAPSQWETSLQSNAVSHWLGANLESAFYVPLRDYIWYAWAACNFMVQNVLRRYFNLHASILWLTSRQFL